MSIQVRVLLLIIRVCWSLIGGYEKSRRMRSVGNEPCCWREVCHGILHQDRIWKAVNYERYCWLIHRVRRNGLKSFFVMIIKHGQSLTRKELKIYENTHMRLFDESIYPTESTYDLIDHVLLYRIDASSLKYMYDCTYVYCTLSFKLNVKCTKLNLSTVSSWYYPASWSAVRNKARDVSHDIHWSEERKHDRRITLSGSSYSSVEHKKYRPLMTAVPSRESVEWLLMDFVAKTESWLFRLLVVTVVC